MRRQTAFLSVSAMRVCQPGPVAFHRANVSGGRRREMEVRALPVFGRPRGLSILAAVCLANISGKTSRALRARAKVSFVHTGFSRSARSGLRLRFIPFYLTFVGLAKTDDMRLSRPRREYQHVQSFCNQPECLKSAFAVVLSSVRNDEGGVPFERDRPLERDSPRRNIAGVFRGIEADVHSYSVYTYIH